MTDFFKAIMRQQERVAIVVGVVALGAGLIQSLLDKANPPILNLWILSALAVVGCLWMLFARGAPDANGRKCRRYSAQHIATTCTIVCVGLASVWGFVFRERLLLSPIAYNLIGGQRVLVSDTVAWHVLPPSSTGSQNGQTVAGELAEVLDGSGYRAVVMSEQGMRDVDIKETDGFILRGVAEEIGVVLDAEMIITEARVERVINQLDWNPRLHAVCKFEPLGRLQSVTSMPRRKPLDS